MTTSPQKAVTNGAVDNDEPRAREQQKTISSLPFKIKALHKKALMTLLRCHHSSILLTYSGLSRNMEIGEKTKAWQCGAWKHLKGEKFIVAGPENKTFVLSPEGIALAESFASDEELAEYKAPVSNLEWHEKIRKRLTKDLQPNGGKHCGKEIFDLFLEGDSEKQQQQHASFLRLELANKLGTNPDAHSFFYGFRAMKKMGLVSETGKVTKEELFTRWAKIFAGDSKKEGKATAISNGKRGKDRLKIEDGQEDVEPPSKKKPRIRGGPQLFQLSEKAFLVKAETTA